jgi:hypothetical protein
MNKYIKMNDKLNVIMRTILFTVLLLFVGFAFSAQETIAQTTTSIAKSLGLYVFPSQNQDQATQDADEIACYKWAMEQTGYDPINPPQIEAEQVDTSPDGTAVRSAARGAAAGAAIGAIAGDTGKGAAIGAAAGGMSGRRAKKRGDQAQQQQNIENADAKEKALLDDFKKAFTVCMEAKGYTIK